MIYVLCIPKELRGKCVGFSKLYAFPRDPEPPEGELRILDSGAFGLSKAGRQTRMSADYMRRLAEYYRCFGNVAGTVCVAPDVFGDPDQTLRQWRWWRTEGFPSVAPVIQFPRKRLDLNSVVAQCRAYVPWNPEFVCISNPGLWAVQAEAQLRVVLSITRELLRPAWVHVLGAGWDIEDILAWSRLGFESIDSIAYYTAAQAGESWDGAAPDTDWRVTAQRNAEAARRFTEGRL